MAGARRLGEVSAGLGGGAVAQGKIKTSEGSSSRAAAARCQRGAKRALWTRTKRVRPNASVGYSDPMELSFGRVMVTKVARMMDKLFWQNDQVPSASL